MPLLKHAKKKLRQDKKRTLKNRGMKVLFRGLIKEAKKNQTAENISKAFQSIDKAAKKNLIHKNKAARLKSALSKMDGTAVVVKTQKAVKKSVKKVSKKSPKK